MNFCQGYEFLVLEVESSGKGTSIFYGAEFRFL